MNKKQVVSFFATTVFLFLLFNGTSQAENISFTPPWGAGGKDADIDFVALILVTLQKVIGYLSILFIVIGGLLYVLGGTAGGNEKMITAGKMCATGSLIGLAIAAAGPAFLQQINLIIFGSKATPSLINPSDAPKLATVFSRTLNFLLSIIGTLAVIGLVISGAMYLLSGGNESQVENAKKAMRSSLIGVAIASGALILVSTVAKFFI